MPLPALPAPPTGASGSLTLELARLGDCGVRLVVQGWGLMVHIPEVGKIVSHRFIQSRGLDQTTEQALHHLGNSSKGLA